MKKSYIAIVLFLSYFFAFGQEMPIDFNSDDHEFITFNEVTTAHPTNKFDIFNNPQDSSDKTGRFFMDGNNPNDSQGFYIDLTSPVNFDENKVLTLDFFKYDVNNHTITIKMEQGGSNPDVEVSVNISGGASTWFNGLQFDFANATTSNNTTINATGNYTRLTLFIDKGVANKPPGTFLFDDINDGSAFPDPNALDVIYSDLVWSDDFDGDGPVDNAKWHHQTFGPNGGQWFNGEQQHYTDSQTNSYVSGGFLNIVAKKDTTTQNGVQLDYTSARLNSKFAFTHGRVDVKAKLPFGDGTWPAIWTLGKNISEPGAWFETQGFGNTPWPDCGEIDIMEHGLHAVNEVSSAIHNRSSFGGTINTSTQMLTDVANTFHVYSMNWSPNQITFMIDGVGYYTYNKPNTFTDVNNDGINDGWPFDVDQFILLNVAMGGIAGTIDPSFTESSMVIDYVKIYQNTTASTDNVFASKFSIYPNPNSSNFVNIKTQESISKIELYNTLGQRILAERNSLKRLDVSSLKAGIYILRIYSGNKTVTKKVLVQ